MKIETVVAPLIFLMSVSQFFGLAKKGDPDQMVLEQLRKAGSNLSKPHKVEFFLYFPTQSAATEAAPAIRKAGFEVDVRPAAQGPGWLCFATRTMIPELTALQKIRRDFTAIAAAKGGEYDGWGTGIVK
jgi:regulator of ribonuclease activity B